MKPTGTFTKNGNSSGAKGDKCKSRWGARKCRELDVQVTTIKTGLVREFGTAIGGHSELLQSALNEAEALAWQTPYPHLLFPVLAHEKASAVNNWAARQRRVQRASREISLAV
jgi:hypothetical protein